ncbi:MAG: hypothetical protein ISR65_17870 [Bacteriovoracaceae bacterium]|nr:hypothetical protein [Bacteriovoracaceae bacterium]
MRSNVTSTNNKLSFILYQKNQLPKYFEINKTFLRLLLVGVPLISLIMLITLLVAGFYFKELTIRAKSTIVPTITKLTKANDLLQKQIATSKEFSQQLQQKLGSKQLPTLASLPLFRPTPGMQDLTGNKNFTIDSEAIEILSIEGAVNINFPLINANIDEQKLSGYIFVVIKTLSTIQVYPFRDTPFDQISLSFITGESFSIQRFKMVNATFLPLPKNTKEIFIKIIIFSRTGDLLFLQKETKQISDPT